MAFLHSRLVAPEVKALYSGRQGWRAWTSQRPQRVWALTCFHQQP